MTNTFEQTLSDDAIKEKNVSKKLSRHEKNK